MWLQSLLIRCSPLLILIVPPSIKLLPLILMSSFSSLSLFSLPLAIFSLLFLSLSFFGLHAWNHTCCVFIIAKAMSYQKTVTHPTLSQSIGSHNPFTPSSMFPEHCRGWHRCLMWGQAHSSHLFSSLWPVMGPSLTIAHCWISVPGGGWKLHKYIWGDVFRRQFDCVHLPKPQ